MKMENYNSTHTGASIDTDLTRIVNLIYPVGSIYMSLNSANPSLLFGGTWSQITDKFILAAGSTYAAGDVGGSSSHTHTTNAGTTGGTAITIAQMPSHGHRVRVWDNAGTTANAWYYNGTTKTTHGGARLYNAGSSTWVASGSTASAAQSGNGDPSGTTDLIGGGGTHNHSQISVGTSSGSNIPPYMAVYVWQRTA